MLDWKGLGEGRHANFGAVLKDAMVRAGQSTEKAALIYRHSDHDRQKEVPGGLGRMVRTAREKTREAQEKRTGGA
ncbi:hypothetical protein [Streptomyces sp. bgisy095]|uniref:hypothetical protein n=1 Tax=unclassified Streptomyces TaxID=2593676 RepID=UPI003D764581